ncbi:ras-domain-containing protein [Didymella exigua CBS 183.55]|uniref:Ras-domain-containing protein n=1 Tax=Didymella exigua CBS 183.55 TaxID=1150837 RepID=A0A6A5RC75_9PLEO|nr:ras-domain-containing protein [Didymella exigua CBS 183.55]KAF1924788.1 ras-domain-containing protein [Didymella exigua CBS 183.55]
MGRKRATSMASTRSGETTTQELGSMYDYLAKTVLLGPSGAGKSCLLHRFVRDEWRVLSSQTIGVEFASKTVHIADRKSSAPSKRKRVKLQLWDTAGTERFRSVSRSYYRGAAGAILVYDVSSWRSFEQLQTFLNDARALAGPDITIILAGNKSDVVDPNSHYSPTAGDSYASTPTAGYSYASTPSSDYGLSPPTPSSQSSLHYNLNNHYTLAPEGREVSQEAASRWASANGIPVAVEVSALSGENVEELFGRLARIILAKIELGEIDPDDPQSGIQYGDLAWDDGASSITSGHPSGSVRWRGGKKKPRAEWEDVFRLSGGTKRGRGCC